MVGLLKDVLLNDVPGLTASATPYVRGGHVGVALSKTGQLEVDTTVLKSALATNLPGVLNLFASAGVASDGVVAYSNSTANTKPGTYAVSITAAATRASHTGSDLGAAFTYSASDGVSDTLSITDSYSGVTTAYVVRQGEDLSTIVSELNTAFGNASMSLTAELAGNSLRIEGTTFGSTRTLSIVGTEATARLGLAAGTYAGADVQGTIGGYSAAGNGQLLTGAAGFDTEGLAITYAGTAANANAGTIRFSLGLGGEMHAAANLQSRVGDGSVVLQTNVLGRSIDLLKDRLENIQSRLDIRREALIKQFTRMEAAMSRFQAQSNSLAPQLAALTGQPRR
ncbi:MAG: hypothetical protein KY464_12795 [Gemmatimonadetes bacterium]|nr:hypothetical protein [Gemmatimonadota bacterium]